MPNDLTDISDRNLMNECFSRNLIVEYSSPKIELPKYADRVMLKKDSVIWKTKLRRGAITNLTNAINMAPDENTYYQFIEEKNFVRCAVYLCKIPEKD